MLSGGACELAGHGVTSGVGTIELSGGRHVLPDALAPKVVVSGGTLTIKSRSQSFAGGLTISDGEVVMAAGRSRG